MKKQHIAIVHMAQWQGLYVNGKLKVEGKNISASDLAHALKLNIHHHYPDGLPVSKATKYYQKCLRLPMKLSDTFED